MTACAGTQSGLSKEIGVTMDTKIIQRKAGTREPNRGVPAPPIDEGWLVGIIRGAVREYVEGATSPWMSLREAAHYARCASELLIGAVNRGELPAVQRVGAHGQQRRWVHRDDVDAWLRSNPYESPWEAMSR